ncbi:MAG: YidC/Oxa1 family membrane protein insertase, partial [Actinomycetota bacterium]
MNPFSAAKDAFTALLDFLHDDVHLTYGWAIVTITLITRLLILPLFLKQYRSMRRMQAYAPQIKELQARYKGNRQKLNEEMMKFYRENEINPFSSCLPLVAQLPIFIVLYYTLRDFSRAAEGRPNLDFMWIVPDVAKDLLDIGWGAGVLLAIYAISQLLSSELSMNPGTPANQKWMMRAIPLGAVLFVTTYAVPTGVVIYWLTTNLWTCGQQLVMKRMIGENPYLEEAAAAASKSGAAPARTGPRSSRTPPKAARAAVAEAGAASGNGGEAGGQ